MGQVGADLQPARLRAREAAWRAALVDELQDGFFVIDADRRVVEVNDGFAAILGYGPEGLPYVVPHPWWPDPAQDPAGYATMLAAADQARGTGRGRCVVALRHRSGHRVWVDIAADAVPDREGSGTAVVGVMRDVTAAHLAAFRARRLADLAAALAGTQTPAEVVAVLAEQVQQALDCQTFSLREVLPGGQSARAMHVGGTPLGYPDRFTEVPLDVPSALAEVATSKQPVFLGSAQENRRRYGAEGAQRYETARIEGLARLPLLVEDELIAILSVGYRAPREFDRDERQFLTTVADLAAQTLGRAVRTERLRMAARRHRLVSAAQAAINRRLDPADQLRALARSVIPELADFSSVHVLATPVPPGLMPPLPVITERVASQTIPGVETAPLQGDIAWYEGDPITETVRHGRLLTQPMPTPAVPEWAIRTGTAATFRTGLNHVVLAPVVVAGLVVAVASFGMCNDRPVWEPVELAIIEEIAGYAAVALEHGLSYQHSRQTALVLQRALLSDPPRVQGVELCGRYVPAGRDQVGGDWYDAFELAPATWPWRSATWSDTRSPPRPRWGSCGPRCAPWPWSATPTRRWCSTGRPRPTGRCESRPSQPRCSPGSPASAPRGS